MSNRIEKSIDTYGLPISILIIIVGLFLTVFFSLSSQFNDWSFDLNPLLLSQYGDLISGIAGPLFTLAGFFLIFKTFRTQQIAIEKQNVAWLEQQQLLRQERFETTFFNLVNNQNLIANDLKVYFKSLQGLQKEVINTVIGREFFAYSINELRDIWNSLNKKKYAGYYDHEIAEYKQQEIEDLYNISSEAFTHPDDARIQEKQIEYDVRLTQINKYYRIDGVVWDKFKKLEINEKTNLAYGIYFQKYHYAAGHYFRHLYHILDYLEESEKSALSEEGGKNTENKYKFNFKKYASFIQSQMTSFELCLLYYNSFSFPKMLRLVKKYKILENLAIEDLITAEHWFDKDISLKERKKLI